MYKSVLLLLATSFIIGCSKEEKPEPKPSDLDPRGVFQPLDNETDPNKIVNWFTKGPQEKVEGIDVERAYKNLKLSANAKSIVVAVIDGGFDLNHEDLKGRWWVNSKEAQGQPGVDDDQNGYIDDINGWNFLGSKDAQGRMLHVNEERLESTRELVRLKKLKAMLVATGQGLQKFDQAYYDKLEHEVTGDRTVTRIQIKYTENAIARVQELFNQLQAKLNISFDKLTLEAVEAFKATTETEQEAKEALIVEFNSSLAKSVERMQIRLKQLQVMLETSLNENFNPRAEVIKDNPDDFSSGNYGNNDVTGPDPLHGTHVAGIIAANRDNGLGIKGVSQYAKIMAIRAVPNGDEYDKDIYFAVKYAVDNGAKIINMSFGKRYSPHKTKLDEIFKYASNRGVLLVHAAGNYAHNNDKRDNYPNRFLASARSDAEIKNWIEVSASSRYSTSAIVANFSNYGKESVDLFAPGYEINSTAPNNSYMILSGTSMAAPVVTGLLSMLMAQNLNYTPEQIRLIALRNGRDKRSLPVVKPGMGELVTFGDLSRYGSIADSYKALEKLLNN